MGVMPTRKEDKVMRLAIDGHEVESLSVALTDVEGKTSEHAIAASALVRALAGELGTSMREVPLATARARAREVRKTVERRCARGPWRLPQGRRGCLGPWRIESHGDEAGEKGRDPRNQDWKRLALFKGGVPRVPGELEQHNATAPCRAHLEKNEKLSTTTPRAMPHHRPLVVEGRL